MATGEESKGTGAYPKRTPIPTLETLIQQFAEARDSWMNTPDCPEGSEINEKSLIAATRAFKEAAIRCDQTGRNLMARYLTIGSLDERGRVWSALKKIRNDVDTELTLINEKRQQLQLEETSNLNFTNLSIIHHIGKPGEDLNLSGAEAPEEIQKQTLFPASRVRTSSPIDRKCNPNTNLYNPNPPLYTGGAINNLLQTSAPTVISTNALPLYSVPLVPQCPPSFSVRGSAIPQYNVPKTSEIPSCAYVPFSSQPLSRGRTVQEGIVNPSSEGVYSQAFPTQPLQGMQGLYAMQSQSWTQALVHQEALKSGIIKFSGEPDMFWPWVSQIEGIIGGSNLHPVEKLRIAAAYCSGEPQKIILTRMSNAKEVTDVLLNAIWVSLVARYGTPLKTAVHLKKRILEFPSMQNLKGSNLDLKFQEYLSLCQTIEYNMDSCFELQYLHQDEGMKTIRRKLPVYMQMNWQKYGQRIGDEQEGRSQIFMNL